MTQLIDKSALVAEIEKLKGKVSDSSSYFNGWQHALRMLELSLDTLEVKEVDSNDTFIEKACAYLDSIGHRYIIDAFRKYMKGE